MLVRYDEAEGVYGYKAGDVLVERATGKAMVAVKTGAGVQLEPLGHDRDYCDRCGAIATHRDAGFSPARQGMVHDCGGCWQAGGAA